jgi:phospholipid/cholesterol/gamma-HCH transport system permease protein
MRNNNPSPLPHHPADTPEFNMQNDSHYTCHGAWTLDTIASLEKILSHFSQHCPQENIIIDGSDVIRLDSAGAWLLHRTRMDLEARGGQVQWQGFNAPQHTLLDNLKNYDIAPVIDPVSTGVCTDVGYHTVSLGREVVSFLAFLGENTIVALRVLTAPSRIRWREVMSNVYHSGVTALPIVGLMSFLIGVVIAYQGGVQLKLYGANILVADLVGITLLRELAPLLTAIIIAGRSGSAYTAQIGTMVVTEEVDALRTIGISPLELLVFPKVIALMVMLPLLTAYADVMGILGGMVIAFLTLDVGFNEFLDRLQQTVTISTYLVGVGKAPVFAVIIALVGCYHGFQASGSADSVGQKVTTSVVQAIFLVIVSDAVFAILFGWVGI